MIILASLNTPYHWPEGAIAAARLPQPSDLLWISAVYMHSVWHISITLAGAVQVINRDSQTPKCTKYPRDGWTLCDYSSVSNDRLFLCIFFIFRIRGLCISGRVTMMDCYSMALSSEYEKASSEDWNRCDYESFSRFILQSQTSTPGIIFFLQNLMRWCISTGYGFQQNPSPDFFLATSNIVGLEEFSLQSRDLVKHLYRQSRAAKEKSKRKKKQHSWIE